MSEYPISPDIATTYERHRCRNIQYRRIFRQNPGHVCIARQPSDGHPEDTEKPYSSNMQYENVPVKCAHGLQPQRVSPRLLCRNRTSSERHRCRNIHYRWILRQKYCALVHPKTTGRLKPNAGPQAPPIAGATQERKLLAVACRPTLGVGTGNAAPPLGPGT